MAKTDRDGEAAAGVLTGAGGGDLDAQRRHGRRRPDRRWRPAAGALACVLVAGALALGVAACTRAAPGESGTASAGVRPAAAGWRFESSRGVQIEVPADWAVNDYGCNMSDRPTVVRAQGVQTTCLTPESATKQVAIIGHDGPQDFEPGLESTRRDVSLDGVSAERTEWRGADDRYFGWLRIPSRQILVSVRSHDPEISRRILDSARLVSVDHNGCPLKRPPEKRPEVTHFGARWAMAPDAPSSISICYYGEAGDTLQTSARVSGQEAAAVAAALNSAASGSNPDADPNECTPPPAPPSADVVLLVEDADRRSTIYVAFSGCTGRGLDNGALRARVNQALIQLVMAPLRTGYSFHGDLNR